MKPASSASVSCPFCNAINATGPIATARNQRCGTCGGELFPSHPFALRSDNVDSQLHGSTVPLIVHYWATWCAPCSMLAPIFEDAAAHRRDLRFASCDIESEPDLAQRHGVTNLPTLIMFVGAREHARICGTMRLGALLDWLQRQTGGGAPGLRFRLPPV